MESPKVKIVVPEGTKVGAGSKVFINGNEIDGLTHIAFTSDIDVNSRKSTISLTFNGDVVVEYFNA